MAIGSPSKDEQQLTAWLEELEATAGRFHLLRTLDELAEVRGANSAPQAMAMAGGASAAQATVARFLESLRSCLAEGLTTITEPSAEDAGGAAPLLFVETLEFGSIRRDVMARLVELAGR